MKSLRVSLLALLLLAWAGASRAQDAGKTSDSDALERHFEMLKVGELAFTNVWVHRQTNFNILIRHTGGIHTIKLTDLPSGELAELRSQIGELASVDTAPPGNALIDRLTTALKSVTPRTWAIAGAAGVLLIILVIAGKRRGQSAPPA
jgi:hypothetical protein